MINYLKQLLDDYIKSMSGIKVGEIDIGDQVVDNEYKIKLLFKILQKVLDRAVPPLTQEEINKSTDEAAQEMKEKYPNSGIQVKK